MEDRKISVLYVDDNYNDLEMMDTFIKNKGLPYDCVFAESVSEGRKILQSRNFDVVIFDYMLGEGCAFDLFDYVDVETPIVILTGVGEEAVAVQAMKQGAVDYIIKDVACDYIEILPKVINRVLNFKKLEKELSVKKICYIDDNARDMALFQLFVNDNQLPYDCTFADSVSEGRKILESESFDVVFLDFHLKDGNALDLFGCIHPDVPIVIVTGTGNEETAVQAMKKGATDYVIQDLDGHYLKIISTIIDNAIKHKKSKIQFRRYHEQLETMVEERTRQLKQRNEELNIEIQERKKAEKEKEKLETQLRQTHKLEAIGTLAGGIAHDFNNILFSIYGYTEIAIEDVQESHIKKNLYEVLKAAERGKDLARRILTFSRQKIENKKIAQKIQPVIKEAISLIRSTLPATIKIEQNINELCGPVLADQTQIHQILVNLCTNAFYAMREKGGLLKVELDELVFSPDDTKFNPGLAPGTYAKLDISDTGAGIGKEIIEKIFDPFFTTKATGEGTGLGLSVVHGIVKNHDGHITVYSTPEQGTVFHIYLPLTHEKKCEPEVESAEYFSTGHEHILLVDDEEQIIAMLEMRLERLGYQITSMTDSLEALDAFRSQPEKFDMVITDMTMPDMTGVEFSKALIKIRSNLPIIICTGYSELITKERARAIGIREVMLKPVEGNEMARIIRRVLADK